MLKRQTAPGDMPEIEKLERYGTVIFDGTLKEERVIATASLVRYGHKEEEISKEEIDEVIERNYWIYIMTPEEKEAAKAKRKRQIAAQKGARTKIRKRKKMALERAMV